MSPPSRLTNKWRRSWTDPALDISIFEPAGGHPEEVRGREDHGELQEAQSNQQTRSAALSPRGPCPRLLGLRTGVSLGWYVRLVFPSMTVSCRFGLLASYGVFES